MKTIQLADGEYVKKVTEKRAIFLHHTAGSYRPDYVVDAWGRDRDKRGGRLRVSTAYVIGGRGSDGDASWDGVVVNTFDPAYWSFHLGVKGSGGALDAQSVGIEICNWGPVTQGKDGGFVNYVARRVPDDQVYDLGRTWRGYRYFHRYTPAQLDAARALLVQLSSRFNIPIRKQWDLPSFDVSARALEGAGGLWTHVNVRKDKTDCHPQPELIQMLNSL